MSDRLYKLNITEKTEITVLLAFPGLVLIVRITEEFSREQKNFRETFSCIYLEPGVFSCLIPKINQLYCMNNRGTLEE